MKNYNDVTTETAKDGIKVTKYTLDGKLHRTDGPAIEYSNGNKYD